MSLEGSVTDDAAAPRISSKHNSRDARSDFTGNEKASLQQTNVLRHATDGGVETGETREFLRIRPASSFL